MSLLRMIAFSNKVIAARKALFFLYLGFEFTFIKLIKILQR